MAMSSARPDTSDPFERDDKLAAAKGGDPAARWRALEACQDYLRLVVRRGRWSRAASLQATSDLVQGTVVDGWRHFSKFRGETSGQLRAWLKAILIHASLNARRRLNAAELSLGSEAGNLPGTASSPSQTVQKQSSREALDAALAGLPDHYRAVVRLRIWDELSFIQIGESLGVSEDAARMIYGRALAKLRESMRPSHGPG
jgi:RNA polymerase sigma-70 factor, ECF subfamily